MRSARVTVIVLLFWGKCNKNHTSIYDKCRLYTHHFGVDFMWPLREDFVDAGTVGKCHETEAPEARKEEQDVHQLVGKAKRRNTKIFT